MRVFRCACERMLFFENTSCEACGSEVGWCPSCRAIVALQPMDSGLYCCASPTCGAMLTKCANYAQENVCNRCVLVADGGMQEALCDCCRLNDTIPDLALPGNRERWAHLEAAKRRLFYALETLGLYHGSASDGTQLPLSFDFKGDVIAVDAVWRTVGKVERVFTGHAGGKITINVREADDLQREKVRVDLGEAHRTLIGHFRHEIGHYYWDLLVQCRQEDAFRRLFGNHEDPSYQEALERYYRDGPPADWPERYVSAYATMHPWEDWAETFALYLDIVGVLDTAVQMKLLAPVPADDLRTIVNRYRELGLVLNELNREMGLIDLVPEVITQQIEDKLQLVHDVIREETARRNSAQTAIGLLG